MQPKNARAGTLFTLKSAKSRPKEREIFSGGDNKAAPLCAPAVYNLPLGNNEGLETKDRGCGAPGPSGRRLCTGGSVSDLMRPEIIPHSYMRNTLYDLCR